MTTLTFPSPAAEVRSHEILVSIRQAFAEKGFDGASMQDLARSAGMSVGNFYRYFPSKAAIVHAMCAFDLAEIQREFAEIQQSDEPLGCLRDGILGHFGEDAIKDGQLWAEITAVAIRKPEIGAAALQMEETIVSLLATIFGRVTHRSVDEAKIRYEGQCQMLVMLVKAMATRTAQCGPASPALADQMVNVVDRILTDISNDKAEG
jgi:AcrR family transcriptional regulator